MNRKQIRIKIHDLLDKHGESFYQCKGCSICTELKSLREPLVRDPAEKFKRILDKGQDMTKSDIELLIENGVQKQTIRKAVGMDKMAFLELIKNFGLNKKWGEDMAKINLEMYKDLKAKGLTDKEIAKKVEIVPAYLSQMKKKWYQAEETELKAVKTVFKTNTIPEDKTAEYNQLINALRSDLKEAHDQMDEKDELVRKLQEKIQKYEHINAACEDVESELDSVREENKVLKKRVEELESAPLPLISPQCDCIVKVNHLQEENQAMRQLLKLWM